MPKRKESGFEQLASMRWPVPVVLGIIAYVSIHYGIGWLFGSSHNVYLAGLARGFSSDAFAPLAWLVLGLCWLAALVSYIGAKGRRRLLETQTGLDSVRGLSWRQFELLVGEAFRRQGYTVQETGLGGADGGIDLLLHKDGKLTLVQCKRWKTQRVDVKVVREMFGLLAHHQASDVKIIAVGDYTADARRFAAGKPIELITGATLLDMVRSVRTAPASLTPQARASAALETPPPCPKCGKEMQLRTNRRTNERFWGCTSYPSCRGTRQLVENAL
ncbi:restriction endonuclease [Frateuria terrea]|uniref:Restriction system protein n=1 Tax=Frateuria terrea TaxID=529704 RepID=A0A1H6QP41_9GAMM|nr:restriction endonuclease [Frateuria terrea]SEI45343.1 restriction system protein [Frateuria terrea]SFP11100.1 restriction system protein [Frateuria terrea]